MLSIEKLNTSDLATIKGIPKTFKVTAAIYSIFLIPAAFLLGLFGLLKKGHGYWPTTVSFLVLFTLLLLWTLLKDYIAYKKDLRIQIKIKGTITVTGKSMKKGDKTIYTNEKDLRKFQVYLDIFDEIQVGDKLNIEISKYSRQILLLEKNETSIINGH
ncbi:MAG: hypothetical protein WBC06_05275 [Chitinophagaceae bacterium]